MTVDQLMRSNGVPWVANRRGVSLLVLSSYVGIALFPAGRAEAASQSQARDSHPAHTVTECIQLGDRHLRTGYYIQAEREFRYAHSRMAAAPNPNKGDKAKVLEKLARSQMLGGKYALSAVTASQAVTLISEAFGRRSPEYVRAMRTHGEAFASSGKRKQAGKTLRSVLALSDELLGKDSVESLDIARLLALVHLMLDEEKEANRLFLRCKGTFDRQTSFDRLEHAECLNSFGLLARTDKEFAIALSFFTEAVKCAETIVEAEHPVTLRFKANIAAVRIGQGTNKEVIGMLEKTSLALAQRVGESHPEVGRQKVLLGYAHEQAGNLRKARGHYDTGLGILETSLGPDHLGLLNVLLNLASVCFKEKDYKGLESVLSRARSILEKEYGSESVKLLFVLNGLYVLYRDTENTPKRKEVKKAVLAICKKHNLKVPKFSE